MPGFIYRGVLTQFVPLREQGSQENVLLGYVTGTVFTYVVCSPLIFVVIATYTLRSLITAPSEAILILFGILFLIPAVLAISMAYLIQHDVLSGIGRLIKLKFIHPIPTGWDWKFGGTSPSYVLVTLVNGTVVAGWFGEDSMASSDPDRRDLFLEKVYTIPPDGSAWVETPNSAGIYFDGKQIAAIEFRSKMTRHE